MIARDDLGPRSDSRQRRPDAWSRRFLREHATRCLMHSATSFSRKPVISKARPEGKAASIPELRGIPEARRLACGNEATLCILGFVLVCDHRGSACDVTRDLLGTKASDARAA